MNINKRGAKVTKMANYPLYGLLVEHGYNYDRIYKELKLSPVNMVRYFGNPQLFRVEQIERISFLTMQPFSRVINLARNCPKSSVHWLDENYSPEQHIEKLKKGK